MREDKIQQFLEFIKSEKVANVPLEQRKKFLEGKLTEEEISEVIRRYEKEQASAGSKTEAPRAPSASAAPYAVVQ